MRVKAKQADVFEQLGFTPQEAGHLRARAAMMTALIDEIERRGLTQSHAAKLMSVSQPRVSDLMRGKFHLFSMDTLAQMLSSLGLSVEVKVKRKVA